jgi:hypothetical protein
MARYQKPTDISGGIGGIKILNRKEGDKRAGNTSNTRFKHKGEKFKLLHLYFKLAG